MLTSSEQRKAEREDAEERAMTHELAHGRVDSKGLGYKGGAELTDAELAEMAQRTTDEEPAIIGEEALQAVADFVAGSEGSVAGGEGYLLVDQVDPPSSTTHL